MLNTTKSININATSYIDADSKNNVIAYFNAQIQNDGKYSVNYTIQNRELYDLNKETFDSDKASFEKIAEKEALNMPN